jgi:hypothetical protein
MLRIAWQNRSAELPKFFEQSNIKVKDDDDWRDVLNLIRRATYARCEFMRYKKSAQCCALFVLRIRLMVST